MLKILQLFQIAGSRCCHHPVQSKGNFQAMSPRNRHFVA